MPCQDIQLSIRTIPGSVSSRLTCKKAGPLPKCNVRGGKEDISVDDVAVGNMAGRYFALVMNPNFSVLKMGGIMHWHVFNAKKQD